MAMKIAGCLWHWLAQSKDQISALQSIATVIALIVSACWIVRNFDVLSEWTPQVRLDQTVKTYTPLNDAILLQVDVTLTNSSKRSMSFHCHDVFIKEFLPLSKENADNLRRGLSPDVNFSLNPPPMKSFHWEEELVVPAEGSATWRNFFSVSPYASHYISIEDKSAKIESIVVINGFFADPGCVAKQTANSGPLYKEVTSLFDISTNKNISSTQN